MARWFSWRAPLSFKGRKFKGLRGFAGKPFHPPLTDVPVTCYALAGIFDLISYLNRGDAGGRDFFVAGTYVLAAGAIASVPTILTGFWDWLKSTPKGSQVWRTANSHMAIMVIVNLLVLANLVSRMNNLDQEAASLERMVLSLVIAALVALGAYYGGALVYEYGFNVENATDLPEYHPSEEDRLHGAHGG